MQEGGGEYLYVVCVFFFSSRRRHTRLQGDWSSDVCSSDLAVELLSAAGIPTARVDAEWLLAAVLGAGRFEAQLDLDRVLPAPVAERYEMAIKIGRASCRERGEDSVDAGTRKQEHRNRKHRR